MRGQLSRSSCRRGAASPAGIGGHTGIPDWGCKSWTTAPPHRSSLGKDGTAGLVAVELAERENPLPGSLGTLPSSLTTSPRPMLMNKVLILTPLVPMNEVGGERRKVGFFPKGGDLSELSPT